MWLFFPISDVKQRAGLTLEAEKSSKGKGTSTIEFLIMKWFSVSYGVNIFIYVI